MTADDKAPPVRRNVRPSFADDVYGGQNAAVGADSSNLNSNNSNVETATTTAQSSMTTIMSPALQQVRPKSEMCESSLAQRRAANLPKLKELAPEIKPSMDYSHRVEMSDIDYRYFDADCYETELAELYTYSEMEDWAIGLEVYNKYADNRNISQIWKEVEWKDKKRTMADLIQMLESTESSVRLESARLFLYFLQGAYGDFKSTDDDDGEVNIDKLNFDPDKGTGGKEHECLVSGAVNAYLVYEQGLYPALCSMLLYEIQEPFDVNYCADRSRSRQSSMSNSSRSASNIDLADSCSSTERRSKRSATLADNENIRVVLNCLYHMLEAIRREDWLEEIADVSNFKVDDLLKLRKRFLVELDEPLETVHAPLVTILFDMMPSFARGVSPHYPMKKVLLLVWKIMLATLGGFEHLKNEKNNMRKEADLPIFEDTIEVAGQMKAVRINSDGGILSYRPPLREKVYHPPRLMSRQLACTSNSKDEDDLPQDTPAIRARGGGSSDDESGTDGLPGIEGDDDVIDDKAVPNAKAEESSPPPDNLASTPTVLGDQPRFAGNIAYQEFLGTGDLTPKAGSPKKIGLPWASKVKEQQIDQFLQQSRLKFFGYYIPGDVETTFNLPRPLEMSVEALRRHVYKSLSEIQMADDVNYNKFPFTQKEKINNSPVERLYTMLLPAMGDYLVALLKILLAALPSSKSKGEALSILSDVLTPETDNNEMLSNSINLDASTRNVLEEHVRVAIDIARHKEIMIKAISGILILFFKWLKLNHVYQYESVGQHMIMLNCVPLMLKFLDQNMVKYIQAKNELAPFNYPGAPLYFARNREEWPVLSADNVDDTDNHDNQSYYIWRNVFSSINIVRLLNKITKGRQPRTMMLVVFKSAPILKRCLRVKCGIFQLYCLKLLKSQCRFLGRQWRKSNMDVMSAIYTRVRHRLNDDWAYANDIRNKQWDFQSEEKDLKLAVEKFHSRRYSKFYPQFKLNQTEASGGSQDYFDQTSITDFEPVDNCMQSLLKFEPVYSVIFKRNYEKWLENEVYNNEIDWDKLLDTTKGMTGRLKMDNDSVDGIPEILETAIPPESRDRISTVVARNVN